MSDNKYTCPLTEIEFVGKCPISRCMYHSKKSGDSVSECRYAEIHALSDAEGLPRPERKKKIAALFAVDREEAQAAVARVVSVLCLNEYFKYVFDKEVTEAKAKELDSLAMNPERYRAWKSNARKVRFDDIVTAIDFLKKNL